LAAVFNRLSRIFFLCLSRAWITVILMIIPVCIFAQQQKYGKQRNTALFPHYTVNYSDTSITATDTTKSNNNHEKSEAFFDTLKVKAGHNKITRGIHDLLVVKSKKSTGNGTKKNSEHDFIYYKNKIIRTINIQKIDIFGPTVNDTAKTNNSWLSGILNSIHINTHDYVIKNRLLVKPGDQIDPYILADNERFIRGLPYIRDARFILQETDHPDSLDLMIITQDVLPMAFNPEISSVNSGSLAFWNSNLLGTGHELYNQVHYNGDMVPFLGYSGHYSIFSLGSSFVKAYFEYKNKFETTSYKLDISRDFFTSSLVTAGGLTLYSADTEHDVDLYDTVLSDYRIRFTNYDMWLGRSFMLNSNNHSLRTRKYMIVAARLNRFNYFNRPGIEENLLYDYHNRTILLGSIGISGQAFFKSNLIYSFGTTEDIPVGMLVQLNAGYEFKEFHNRPYLGGLFLHGNFTRSGSYVSNKIEIGGFINSGHMEQNIFDYTFNYFSPLITINRFKFRLFAKSIYKIGLYTYKEESVNINNLKGVNGLIIEDLKGKQKLVGNIEAVCFSPYYLYGFRFVFFTAFDIGYIGTENKFILENPAYTGISVGVRIKNERLAFNTLQFRFSFYPNAPSCSDKRYFNLTGEQRLSPENFYYRTPRIIRYE